MSSADRQTPPAALRYVSGRCAIGVKVESGNYAPCGLEPGHDGPHKPVLVPPAALPSICDLALDEVLAGPGGFTSRTFEDGEYVSLAQYEWASDFAYCLADRLKRALAEAERHGIDRATMEKVMQHGR